MSKTLYAPRRVKFYSDGDCGYIKGDEYIVDVANLRLKKECVFYNNEAYETKIEVYVNFPRESRECDDVATLAPDEIFEKYEDCLAYVETLNKQVQGSFSFNNKDAERLEAEKKDADEYINSAITV